MPVPPPSKHQLALMIWLAVFPTLVVLNLTLGRALGDLAVVPRTFVLATVAVPIVIYGLMPHLHRLRARLLTSLVEEDRSPVRWLRRPVRWLRRAVRPVTKPRNIPRKPLWRRGSRASRLSVVAAWIVL